MPRYDYECSSCNHKEEHEHSMKDKLSICPKCKKTTYSVVIRPTAIKFNGSGFFVNDYKDSK